LYLNQTEHEEIEEKYSG